ncbi:hypothetical protein Hanom_Chr06g00493861 [Helianthus anomalus]
MCVRETPIHRLFPVIDSGKGPVVRLAFLPPLTSGCATASPASCDDRVRIRRPRRAASVDPLVASPENAWLVEQFFFKFLSNL